MDERVRRTVATYEDNAEAYERVHDDRSVVAEMVEGFLAAVGDPADDGARGDPVRVLDVGPGPGWESAAFADHGFDVAAVDVTRSFLRRTRERDSSVGVVGGDMRSLPFADGAFDGLWACASLLHVPRGDVPGTLAEFERVLAPGGVAVVSVQESRDEWDSGAGAPGDGRDEGPYDEDRRHFEQHDPAAARSAFAAAGFDGVEVTHDDGTAWFSVTARVPSTGR